LNIYFKTFVNFGSGRMDDNMKIDKLKQGGRYLTIPIKSTHTVFVHYKAQMAQPGIQHGTAQTRRENCTTDPPRPLTWYHEAHKISVHTK